MLDFSAIASLPIRSEDSHTGEIFMHVSPTDPRQEWIRNILLHEEMVYPMQSMEELETFRLGERNSNKQCFALLSPDGDRVRSMVSVNLMEVQEIDGAIHVGDLPHNIPKIRWTKSAPQPDSMSANLVVPFSITNNAYAQNRIQPGNDSGARGAAERLIDKIYDHFHGAVAISTTSPYPAQWITTENMTANNQRIQHTFSRASQNRAQEKPDGRLDLHPRMGAWAFYRNGMINYVYDTDPEIVRESRAAYQNEGRIMVAGYIYERLTEELRERAVRGPSVVALPGRAKPHAEMQISHQGDSFQDMSGAPHLVPSG